MKQYIRLPNGQKKLTYLYFIGDEESTIQFVDQKYDDIKDFFGMEIIDYVDFLDENDTLLNSFNIYQKISSISYMVDTITEYESRIAQEAYDEKILERDEETDTIKEKIVHHDAIYQDVPKNRTAEIISVKLSKPSIREEVENIKSVVGIVNTNSMSLEEFRDYYKEQIGKQCTAAIESGLAIETSLGNQHFSYTIEDQSNVKDLVMTAELTDFTLPLPYHANGELCTLYPATDILKIYMSLSANKTYHTTYCNVLNAMLKDAKDIDSIKKITYGMEITDEKYTDTIKAITDSKDALLAAVKKKLQSLAGNIDNDNSSEDSPENPVESDDKDNENIDNVEKDLDNE